MASLADLLGVPHEVVFEGKTYKLREPKGEEQLLFVRWLERRAREHAARAVELPPEQQDKMLRWAGEDAAACTYEWEGDACRKALTTPLGMAKILELVIRDTTDPGFTFEDAQRLVRAGVADVLREVLAAHFAAEGVDPKAAAAVLDLLGLPRSFSPSPSPTPPSTSPPSESSG